MNEKKRQHDKYGFVIWEDEDHSEKWDGDTTIEQLLLTSVDKSPPDHSRESLGRDFKVADDEQLFAYRYGGVLSSRGGWFVVSMYKPYRILRSKGTWLS